MNKKHYMCNGFLFKILIILLSAAALCGCGLNIETVDEHNKKQEAIEDERNSALESLLAESVITSSEKAPEEHTSDMSVNVGNDENITENISDVSDTDIYTQFSEISSENFSNGSNIAQTSGQSDSKNNVSSDNQATTPPGTESSGETVSEKSDTETEKLYILVHLKITCSKVIGHPDLNTDAKLPDDGIILDTYVAVKEGDSVFSALKAATDDNGIALKYTGSQYGAYIAGICGLNEKQCGKYSGWKYSVNNVYPNVSCGGYSLKNGDDILFGFTYDLTAAY